MKKTGSAVALLFFSVSLIIVLYINRLPINSWVFLLLLFFLLVIRIQIVYTIFNF